VNIKTLTKRRIATVTDSGRKKTDFGCRYSLDSRKCGFLGAEAMGVFIVLAYTN
jgi:hypothetical protein